MTSPVAAIVAKNLMAIIDQRVGPSLIVDRTAAANGGIDNGVFAISTNARTSDLKLPGVTIVVRPHAPHQSDLPFMEGITLAAAPRTLVDNLAGSSRSARYLTNSELEDWLTMKRLSYLPERFDRLRQESHDYANDVSLGFLHDRIDGLFATVSNQPGARKPSGALTQASARNDLYDDARLALFADAATQLNRLQDQPSLPEHQQDGELPFYEAYFSNYIEGTKFSLEQARHIVATNQTPDDRPADGHDILGTYYCVVDRAGRSLTSPEPDVVIATMKNRHRTIMAGRPELTPGEFKTTNNYVGQIAFVDWRYAHGTITRAIQQAATVPAGFPRAVYMMLISSEIHPFLDGNGRAARLMMNAELSAQGLCRIVIPTVIRDEYIMSLRRFTTNGNIDALIAVLSLCWRWTFAVPWDSGDATEGYLHSTNAFTDSVQAAADGVSLTIH